MITHIFNILLLISLLTKFINTARLNKGDNITLVNFEHHKNISKFNISIINKVDIIDDLNYFHVIDITDINNITNDTLFSLTHKYFNKFWFIYIEDFMAFNNLIKNEDLKVNKTYKNCYFFISKNLSDAVISFNYINNYNYHPIFEVGNDNFELMKNYNLKYANKNYYSKLLIKRRIITYPRKYLILNSFLFLIISIIVLIFWIKNWRKVDKVHILSIHTYINLLPYGFISVELLFLLRAITINLKDLYSDEGDEAIYIDIILYTLNGLYKAIFWIFLYLLLNGYNTIRMILKSNDSFYLVRIFVFIYMPLSTDVLFDVFDSSINNIRLSDIKNVIFYIIMYLILSSNYKRGIKFLGTQLFYAIELVPEFIEPIKYKIKLFYKLIKIPRLYLLLYFICFYCNKFFFYEYNNYLIELYNFEIVDNIMIIYFLWEMRPKILPINYLVDLGEDMDRKMGDIFKCQLPEYEFVDKLIPIKKQKDKKKKLKNKKNPIVLIQPNNIYNNTENEQTDDLTKYLNRMHFGTIDY